MIQTICLLRKKEDDIWAIYILEFLKLIGCIVSDCIVDRKCVMLEPEYDAYIFLNYSVVAKNQTFDEIYNALRKSQLGKESNNIIIVRSPVYPKNIPLIKLSNVCEDFLWTQIISRIWNLGSIDNPLRYLVYSYCRSGVFFYLYNKDNLKFVQEYYPLFSDDRNEDAFTKQKKYREEAWEKTFYGVARCYNLLLKFQETQTIENPYYRFAMLKLRFLINDVIESLGNVKKFNIVHMLADARSLRKAFPEFILPNYLCAKICMSDVRYLVDAGDYYKIVLKMVEQQKVQHACAFLYYQFGKYYEKAMNEKDMAYELYQIAYDVNPMYYRALYKKAKWSLAGKQYDESSEILNKIIGIILNGYNIDLVMPKQQIYVYKAFVLLGDIYFDMQLYDLAIKSYERAVEVSDITSPFFLVQDIEESMCFEQIMVASMPKQTVYLNIISSAAKCQNQKKINEYNLKLRYLN